MPKLSILIPTTIGRNHFLVPLVHELKRQIKDLPIEILINSEGKELPIGTKRQRMIEQAQGDYIAFVDDDDMITSNYISKIMEALEQSPDVVGMRGWMTTNGDNRQSWSISTKYKSWAEDVDGIKYVRYPNHLVPVKKEFTIQAGFGDERHGEDYLYSMRLLAQGNLKKEVFIDEELYHYRYVPKK